MLTLTSRAPTGQPGRWHVEFQEKIGPAAGAGGVSGLSLRGAAEVDCSASQIKVGKLSVFEGPDFTGALLAQLSERSEWRPPEPGTAMERVLAVACGKTKVGAKVQAKDQAEVSAPPPAPPAAAPKPPAPAPVAEIVAQTLAPPAAPPIAAPTAGGAFYAQLASVSSADAARRMWETLKGAAPGILDDRQQRLTTATVHGRRVWRVQAGGFATKAQAEKVCQALARLSARCFVRPGDAT
jgi:cell division septation protein DedD